MLTNTKLYRLLGSWTISWFPIRYPNHFGAPIQQFIGVLALPVYFGATLWQLQLHIIFLIQERGCGVLLEPVNKAWRERQYVI